MKLQRCEELSFFRLTRWNPSIKINSIMSERLLLIHHKYFHCNFIRLISKRFLPTHDFRPINCSPKNSINQANNFRFLFKHQTFAFHWNLLQKNVFDTFRGTHGNLWLEWQRNLPGIHDSSSCEEDLGRWKRFPFDSRVQLDFGFEERDSKELKQSPLLLRWDS